MSHRALRGAVALSILAAVATIGMKAVAYAVTGSAGLLADALESGVNLLAAATAYFSLWYAARPADQTHAYGHEKIEFFASGMEGGLILLAGVGTAYYAVDRLLHPQELERLGLGAAVSGAAAAVNLVVARILLRHGRQHSSPVVEADGHHLMADVITSAGVLVGLGLVAATGLTVLDPLMALAVGGHIGWIGFGLVRLAVNGLMDHALPTADQDRIRAAVRAALPPGSDFHALRTRRAGQRSFAEFHILVPGVTSVRDAHALAHRVEEALHVILPGLVVTTHLEPIEDRDSWESLELARLGERVEP